MKSRMERVKGCGYSSQKGGLGAFRIGLVLALMGPAAAWSQTAAWSLQSASGSIYYNGGNVGIGYSYPVAKLQVASADGNTALGVTDLNGTFRFAMNTLYSGSGWTLYDYAGNAWHSGITQTAGNVGIGTANPQHMLHVAGTIGAQEVIVSSTGADYVFDPDYKLKPLSEVAEYVAANRHLPGIPSATEVQKQGISVGEMQTKLLAKIEELTLHMIASEQRGAALERKNERLAERVNELEGRLGGLH